MEPRAAESEALTILGMFFIDGPDLAISKEATSLLRQIADRPDQGHPDVWSTCARLCVEVGQPYERRHAIESLLKRIELFALDRHSYVDLAKAMLRRASFYCQLLEDPCDESYGQAARLERCLTDLVDGPLRGQSELQHELAILRLHLAQLRGDLEQVRRSYEALTRIVTNRGDYRWQTSFEGIRTYTMLGDLKRAEQSLSATRWPWLVGPGFFNHMRRARAKVILRLAQRETDEACAILEREYRPLCERYQSWPDIRFWQGLTERFDLPQIGHTRARIVLFPSVIM
jgi:hypothetical protein